MKRLLKSAIRVLGPVAIVVLMVWVLIAQPSCRGNHVTGARTDPVKLQGHVATLSQRFSPRDYQHTDNLDHCSEYISQHFRQAGADVEFQSFSFGKKQYRNVIGRFSAGKGARVIVGAHYDACGEQPGAMTKVYNHSF